MDQSELKHREEEEGESFRNTISHKPTDHHHRNTGSPSLLVRGPELGSGVFSQEKSNSDEDVFEICNRFQMFRVYSHD